MEEGLSFLCLSLAVDPVQLLFTDYLHLYTQPTDNLPIHKVNNCEKNVWFAGCNTQQMEADGGWE